MSLAQFFDEVGAYLAGGPAAVEPDDGLRFYAHLVKFDQQRILGEMFPRCRQWCDRLGLAWEDLAQAYVDAHPPAGWSVPHLGERFADWLLAASASDPRLPVGIEAVADLAWTRFLARNAPDVAGLGLDQRVFVRRYRADPVAIEGALRRGEPVPQVHPTTMLVFRHTSGVGVRTLPASLATLAVLLGVAAPADPLPGALGQVPAQALAAEHERLHAAGVV